MKLQSLDLNISIFTNLVSNLFSYITIFRARRLVGIGHFPDCPMGIVDFLTSLL